MLPFPTLLRTRSTGLAAAGVMAVLLLCACGSSTDSASSTAATGSDGFAAYTACLAQNGVTLPSGRPGGPGGPGGTGGARPSGAPTGAPSTMPSSAPSGLPGEGPGVGGAPLPEGIDATAFAAAQQACAALRPSGGPAGLGGGPAIDSSALAAYTSCLKDHDVKATTPANLRALDSSDTTVAAALATCAPLEPTPAASMAQPSGSPST